MKLSSRQNGGRRAARELAWADALQSALDDLLSEPAVAGRAVPHITVISFSRTGTQFEIELRFAAGQDCCCIEPGCYLAASDRRWWQRLREKLAAYSDRSPPPITLTVHGVVEKGALLEVLCAADRSQSSDYRYKWGPLREKDAR